MAKNSGLVIGLMSGTSADGIDAALVRFTERNNSMVPRMELVESLYVPYDEAQRESVFRLFHPDVTTRYTAQMEVAMGDWFGCAARELMDKAGVQAKDVDAIGSHGQTVCHYPDEGVTLQIGDPARISAITGCPVVSNFRRADVALGGQGAPLVPYFDYAYYHSDTNQRVLLNIGGISNITILPPGGRLEQVAAFDTGPGNMMIDAAVTMLTNGKLAYDKDGAIAGAGAPALDIVEKWFVSDEYVHAKPPKSTGRERYGQSTVAKYLQDVSNLPTEGQVSTLTYYVAKTIAHGIRSAVQGDFELIIGGGGRHNASLVKWIEALCTPARIVDSESFGIPTDMKEAMAFALFAWQFLQGRPTNIPTATGARAQTLLGEWTPRPYQVSTRETARANPTNGGNL